MHWIPDWSGRSCIAGHIRSPFSPGPHRIDGYLEVQIVQLSSSDFDHWPVDATPDRYRAIPETFVTVPVPKLEFTSVHAYPSNYPPRIVDDAEAARIESGFHLARVERIYGSSNNKARLVIEATFPGHPTHGHVES